MLIIKCLFFFLQPLCVHVSCIWIVGDLYHWYQCLSYQCSQYSHSHITSPVEFFCWVCYTSKLILTSYIALVFYSKLPLVCIIHVLILFTCDSVLFLVILICVLTCAAGATCRITEIIEQQIDKLSNVWNKN